MREITPQELCAHLERADPAPLLLDVREPWEYAICRIEGSRLVPMRNVPAAATELDPDTEVITICHHGIRSLMVARHLSGIGFRRVINLRGGINAWAREVDPAMPVY